MDEKFNFTGTDNLNMPFSLDAEQAVLGCILMEPSSMSQVQTHLRPEYFFLPQHTAIYSIMVGIDVVGGKIDPLLVLDKLKHDNVYDDAGGKNYLYQLASITPSAANVESYAKIVKEKFYMRTLINVSKEIIDSAVSQEDSAEMLLDAAEQKIYDIRQGRSSSAPSKISDIIINEVYTHLEKLNSDEREQYLGLPTGYKDLDDVIVGLHKSDLILVGARPAMGKTSFALNIARNVADRGKRKVLVFSLEMTKEQLAQRVLATEARILGNKMRDGRIEKNEWAELGEATARLNDCELYFDDSTDITVSEMKARTRRLGNVDCVFIDYLGLIRSGSRTENRVQEVTEITRSLKLMAKNLNIPVFVCAQLSRGTEHRGKSHRPQLSDLRESGSIEQDADIVIMLYRQDYYTDEEHEQDEDDPEARSDEVEVIIAKNRHGPTKTVKFYWDSDHTLFRGKEHIRND